MDDKHRIIRDSNGDLAAYKIDPNSPVCQQHIKIEVLMTKAEGRMDRIESNLVDMRKDVLDQAKEIKEIHKKMDTVMLFVQESVSNTATASKSATAAKKEADAAKTFAMITGLVIATGFIGLIVTVIIAIGSISHIAKQDIEEQKKIVRALQDKIDQDEKNQTQLMITLEDMRKRIPWFRGLK